MSMKNRTAFRNFCFFKLKYLQLAGMEEQGNDVLLNCLGKEKKWGFFRVEKDECFLLTIQHNCMNTKFSLRCISRPKTFIISLLFANKDSITNRPYLTTE